MSWQDAMVSISEHEQIRTTAALITGMDRPLGKTLGGSLGSPRR